MKKAAQYGPSGLIILFLFFLSGQINNLGDRIDRIAEKTNERIDRHLESAKHLAEVKSDTLREELVSEINPVSPESDWAYYLDPYSEYPPLYRILFIIPTFQTLLR